MLENSNWFVIPERRPRCKARILCFPYAGGSAGAFRSWGSLFPDSIELVVGQLPGREKRFAEPLVDNISEVVEAYDRELRAETDIPILFYGHSLGGLIAYELCLRFAQSGGAHTVLGLVVSGRSAPHVPLEKPWMHTLSGSEFRSKLKTYDGTPKEILENIELLEVVEPRLRADFKIAEAYMLPPRRQDNRVSCPLYALGGTDDIHVSEEELLAWKSYTKSAFQHNFFHGGHFFIFDHQQTIVSIISRLVMEAMVYIHRTT